MGQTPYTHSKPRQTISSPSWTIRTLPNPCPYPTLPYPTLPHPTLSYPPLPYPATPYPTLPYLTLTLTLTQPYPTLPHPTPSHPSPARPGPPNPYPNLPNPTLPYLASLHFKRKFYLVWNHSIKATGTVRVYYFVTSEWFSAPERG